MYQHRRRSLYRRQWQRQTFHFVAYRTIRQTCVYTRHEQHAGNPDQNTVNQECHVFGFYNIDTGCDRGLLIAADGIEGTSQSCLVHNIRNNNRRQNSKDNRNGNRTDFPCPTTAYFPICKIFCRRYTAAPDLSPPSGLPVLR